MPDFEFWKGVLSKQQTVFSSLSENLIEQLLREEVSKERDYPQGHVILEKGHFGDTCFVIGSGSVQVVVQENGGEATLSVLRQGELFGNLADQSAETLDFATVRPQIQCLPGRRQQSLRQVQSPPNVPDEGRAIAPELTGPKRVDGRERSPSRRLAPSDVDQRLFPDHEVPRQVPSPSLLLPPGGEA